jgi:hypothetical protein
MRSAISAPVSPRQVYSSMRSDRERTRAHAVRCARLSRQSAHRVARRVAAFSRATYSSLSRGM